MCFFMLWTLKYVFYFSFSCILCVRLIRAFSLFFLFRNLLFGRVLLTARIPCFFEEAALVIKKIEVIFTP